MLLLTEPFRTKISVTPCGERNRTTEQLKRNSWGGLKGVRTSAGQVDRQVVVSPMPSSSTEQLAGMRR